MVFDISRLLVSAAEANIRGFGLFDLQWSRSIASWISLLGWAASPLKALHHVTYCRTLLPGVLPHIYFNSCNWYLYVSARPRKRTRKAGQRVPWTQPEREAVQRRLARNILLRQVPRKKECESARNDEPILCSRDWRTIKFFVHTQIQREKKFSDS